MTLFRTWLFGIVAAAMALALLYALVPKGCLLYTSDAADE